MTDTNRVDSVTQEIAEIDTSLDAVRGKLGSLDEAAVATIDEKLDSVRALVDDLKAVDAPAPAEAAPEPVAEPAAEAAPEPAPEVVSEPVVAEPAPEAAPEPAPEVVSEPAADLVAIQPDEAVQTSVDTPAVAALDVYGRPVAPSEPAVDPLEARLAAIEARLAKLEGAAA
jgi:outer membrane biosynthesis protein TonB